MQKIKHFEMNQAGRDLVCGDIHGCFEAVNNILFNELNFNPDIDRLFSVGDLVDRGPSSERCLEFLAQPWFHAVRGNHEIMALDYMHCMGMDRRTYIANGGDWFVNMEIKEATKYAKAFEELPYAIDVQTKRGLIGIVHANIPVYYWDEVVKKLNSDEIIGQGFYNFLTWDRSKIYNEDGIIIQGIHKLYVGHTPLKTILNFGNTMYIDTALVFPGGKLTVIDLNTEEVLT